MKFLFHIAYLVCVSSLPISQLPERHLPPIIQSLVGLRSDDWSKSAHLIAKGTGRSDAKCTEGIIITADTEVWPEDPHACDTQLVSDDTKHGILCCTNNQSLTPVLATDPPVDTFMLSPVTPRVPGCWSAAHFGLTTKDQCPTYAIWSSKNAKYFAPGTEVNDEIPECEKKIQQGCMLGTWSEANAKCSDMGARLCTEDELTSGCGDRTGCWFDQRLVWTSPKTTLGYTIELRRKPSAGTDNDMHHLHIKEIQAFDNDGHECELYYGGDASRLVGEGKNGLTPDAAIDGDRGTMNHNNYGPDVTGRNQEDHWMQFECFCESISSIQIYNRNENQKMRERLSNSVLTFMRRSDGATIGSHTITPDETDDVPIEWFPFNGYTIELRRPLVDTGGDRHHLHIREIKAFDLNGEECKLYYDGAASPLIKRGKEWEGKRLTPAVAIDGDFDKVNHNDYGSGVAYASEEHWMQFECYCENLDVIKIYNRNDGYNMAKRLAHSVLKLMSHRDGVTIDSHIITVSEATADVNGIIEWTPNTGYIIELRRPLVNTGGDQHHLHIREIKAFDVNDEECRLYYNGAASPLIKVGKEWQGKHLTPDVEIDGDFGTMNHDDYGHGVVYASEEHWMQFECHCENLNVIKIYNRNDGYNMAKRLDGSVLKVMSRSDMAEIDSHTITLSEATGDVDLHVSDKPLIEWSPDLQS